MALPRSGTTASQGPANTFPGSPLNRRPTITSLQTTVISRHGPLEVRNRVGSLHPPGPAQPLPSTPSATALRD
eukprot:1678293-Pyramimonas_sp.AAC.1